MPLAALNAHERAEFWDTTPDSDWSKEQTDRLTTASPWAIKTKVKMQGSLVGSAPMGAASGRPPADFGTIQQRSPGPVRVAPAGIDDIVPDARAPELRPPLRNSTAAIAFYGDVLVTWESAAPIRLARRAPLDSPFDRHYAIRVTGLPSETFMNEAGRTPVIYRLLTGALLEVNSRRRESSDYVQRIPEKKSLLFAFRASDFPLTRADHFVSFALTLNEMTLRARFDLHRMIYRDLLAV